MPCVCLSLSTLYFSRSSGVCLSLVTRHLSLSFLQLFTFHFSLFTILAMANLQDLRRRVRSVKNMQKITRAMKMVAAAKLRRAQERVPAAPPYSETIMRMLARRAARARDYHH